MISEEALYLLMANQKKVRDDFRFIDLNTQEKLSIEDCYVIVKKDLEALEILKDVFNYKSVQKFIDSMSKEQWIKIKEWLEDDK